MLNITIHRGHNQIGGCITEISTERAKIFIDFGSNLPGNNNEELTQDRVMDICRGADAVFYTHYHGDHVGLMTYIDPEIPKYIGKGAKEVMLRKHKELRQDDVVDVISRMRTYDIAREINIADKISITPYLVSHSAFDAYMFKIKCDGRTVLHTGDFRKHGYLGKGLEPVLAKYVRHADILITEGTMLGRRCENVITENQIKLNTIEFLKTHKYVFALCSSTDIDRLASFHEACRETGRNFFVDNYQKDILDIFTRYSGSKNELFDFDNIIVSSRYHKSQSGISLLRKGFLMPVRTSSMRFLEKFIPKLRDDEPWLIYSMWSGYAEEGKPYTNDRIIKLRSMFDGRIKEGTKDGFHTSGHADVATLSEVCHMVNPSVGVIPIHRDAGTSYESLDEVDKYRIFKEGVTTTDNIRIDIR